TGPPTCATSCIARSLAMRGSRPSWRVKLRQWSHALRFVQPYKQSWCAGTCSAQWTSRSEEHTSELQSPCKLVCRLLLEKKKDVVARRLGRGEERKRRLQARERQLEPGEALLHDVVLAVVRQRLPEHRRPLVQLVVPGDD